MSKDSNFSNDFQSNKYQTLTSLTVSLEVVKASVIETPFKTQELKHSLKTSKGKTPGLDRISYPMLINAPDSFKDRILLLFNNIYSSGIIPQFFKTATVIPIHKNNKPTESIDSYRPISLLPCLAKLLEKIVSRRLLWYIKKHNLLSKNQTGFQAVLGTIDSLLYLDHIICKNLSNKRHTSILSIDFIKAFDKIGVHIVLQKLADWSIGPKMFNFVKSFLTNRKFNVRVNNTYSNIHPLHNGIPQGSPLSVTLFIIAFDDLSRILNNNKKIEHCIYADDLYILAKEQKNNKIEQVFKETLLLIDSWSRSSGANISIEKTNHLHICKKLNCNSINLTFKNTIIQNVNNCKILGLYIDSKYNFKNHCNHLKRDLTKRLNIIKYLSSSKSLMHTNSLLKLTKSIILSKIDYGLAIYNKASNTTFRTLETIMNAALRSSLRAFSTTPIKNILAESGFDPLRIHANKMKFRLLHKISCHKSSPLYRYISLLKKRKTEQKYASTLSNLFKIVNKYGYSYVTPLENNPPWMLDSTNFLTNLQIFNKNNNPATVFKSIFSETLNTYKADNWHFLFTDGSKTANHVGFAITDDTGYMQKKGLLPQDATVFEAEAVAIIEALKLCEKSNFKHIICTDSQSVFHAASNSLNKNDLIVSIQQSLLKVKNKIKLLWIPSHIGILGNETADIAAKNVSREPTYIFEPNSKNFLSRIPTAKLNKSIKRKWDNYTHPYKYINPDKTPIVLPVSTSCQKNKCFVRLRLSHTKLTHEYLLNQQPQPECTYCNNAPLTVSHIVDVCPALTELRSTITNSSNIKNMLKTPSENNINLVFTFLQNLSLHNKI